MPTSPVYARYQSGEGYHVVPPPYTGTFMPPKPDLVFHNAPTVNETVLTAFNVQPSATKPTQDLSHLNRPSAPIIEYWFSDSEDESKGEPMTLQKAPSFVQPSEHIKILRQFVKPVEDPIPAANLKTDIPKPKGYGNSMNRKACFVCKSLTHLIKDCNTHHALKAKGVIDSGFSRHMIGNISYLSDFEKSMEDMLPLVEIQKVVRSQAKVKSRQLPDENHVPLRVPRENNMYNVDLKNIVALGDLTCLFAKATLDEVIDGVVQPVAPTTAEHRFARKNELKTRGTLLMCLQDKHQLKFNIHKMLSL
nr:hypothetical protein [Tanacetum cinerariifolium]